MDEAPLTAEQEQLATELFGRLESLYRDEAHRVARLMARKSIDQTLGKTEFELRDRLHRLGASTLEAALEVRKKGGTRGRV